MKKLKTFEKFINEGILDLEPIQEHDVVELTEDLPKASLFIGDVGTVIHIYSNAKGYVVEFKNNKVETVEPRKIKKKL